MLPDQFCNLTWKEFIAWRLEDSNQGTGSASSTGHRGHTKLESRYKSNQNAYQLPAFRKASRGKCHNTYYSKMRSILRLLKGLLVTATTHDCEDILNGDYKPENNADSRELFKQKQYFMYIVFNKVLQSDMGKPIVRKDAPSLDAQSVWRDFESHMSTSSNGLNERHRLHGFVSTAVYDRYWKGTTEQFVLHVHEEFRQLDEVTPQNEHLPHSVILTLLQTAVRSVPELRIVEAMEEYMSLTNSSSGQASITYDKYFIMLQNACIRYDKNLKQKASTTSRLFINMN